MPMTARVKMTTGTFLFAAVVFANACSRSAQSPSRPPPVDAGAEAASTTPPSIPKAEAPVLPRLLRSLEVPRKYGTPASIAFSNDGRLAAIGTSGFRGEGSPRLPAVLLADVESGSIVSVLRDEAGGTDYVFSVALSQDGRWLLSSHEHMALLWDLASRRVARRLKVRSDARVTHVAFSADGTSAVVGATGAERTSDPETTNGAHVWNVVSGAARYVACPEAFQLEDARLAPEGAIVCGGGGLARLGAARHAIDTEHTPERVLALQTWVAISRGGERAVGFFDDGVPQGDGALSFETTYVAWDTVAWREVSRMTLPGKAMGAVALAENGVFAILGRSDGTAALWSIDKPAPSARWLAARNEILFVGISADGSRGATCCEEKAIHVWDLAPLTR
jgi:WD40 repeat protein